MDYLTLIAPKSTAGSIQNFVRYKPVPAQVILEEAQALIYSQLRVREMRASTLVVLPVGAFTAALPDGYLEAITMRDREGWEVIPKNFEEERPLMQRRVHNTDVVTTLDGDITAAAVSLDVASADEFPTSGDFSIVIDGEAMLVTGGQGTTTWTVTRGFAGTTAAAHSDGATVDGMLETGVPMHVGIFDDLFQFDLKADEIRRLDLVFYKSQALLSASNLRNFLTRRYPHLVRVACNAAAADFMKDREERDAQKTYLMELIQEANAESDMGKAA